MGCGGSLKGLYMIMEEGVGEGEKPPISEQFFHDPPLCLNFKNKKPLPLILGGEETMYSFFHLNLILERQSITVRIKSKVKAFQQIKFNNLIMIFFNSQSNVKII